MGSRPLPPPPPSIGCVCGGRYGLDYPPGDDVPTAYHSLPYCPEFESIETSVDAINHFEKCKEARKPS